MMPTKPKILPPGTVTRECNKLITKSLGTSLENVGHINELIKVLEKNGIEDPDIVSKCFENLLSIRESVFEYSKKNTVLEYDRTMSNLIIQLGERVTNAVKNGEACKIIQFANKEIRLPDIDKKNAKVEKSDKNLDDRRGELCMLCGNSWVTIDKNGYKNCSSCSGIY